MTLNVDSTFLLAHTIYNLYHSGITKFIFICSEQNKDTLESLINIMRQDDSSRIGLGLYNFSYKIYTFNFDKQITPIKLIQQAINEEDIQADNLMILPSNLYMDILPQFITDNHRLEDAGLTIIFGNENSYQNGDYSEGSIEIGKIIPAQYQSGRIYTLKQVDYFQYLQEQQLTEDENKQIMINKQVISEDEPKYIGLHYQRPCGIVVKSRIIEELPQDYNLDLYESLIQYVIRRYNEEQEEKQHIQEDSCNDTDDLLSKICEKYYEKEYQIEDLEKQHISYRVISITFDKNNTISKKYLQEGNKSYLKNQQQKLFKQLELINKSIESGIQTPEMNTIKQQTCDMDQQFFQQNKQYPEISYFNSGIILLQNRFDYLFLTNNILHFNYMRHSQFPTNTIKQQLLTYKPIKNEKIKNILLEYNIYINHEHTLSYINYKKIQSCTIHNQGGSQYGEQKTYIEGELRDCVIGQDANISKNVILENCIVLDSVTIENIGKEPLKFKDCVFGSLSNIQLSGDVYYNKILMKQNIFQITERKEFGIKGRIERMQFNCKQRIKQIQLNGQNQ